MPNHETTKSKPRRTSVGSGKTKGAVSLAFINMRDLAKIVHRDAKVPIGRVFAESLGLKSRKRGGRVELVLPTDMAAAA